MNPELARELRPSKLWLRGACPGSAQAEHMTPQQPATDDQVAGTKRHMVARDGLRDRAVRPIVLATLDTEDDRKLVQQYWREFDARIGYAVFIAEAAMQMDEHRTGTPDVVLWSPETATITVIDLKGWQPSEPARWSLQLADYARAAVEAFQRKPDEIEHYELVIVSGLGVDTARVTPADMVKQWRRIGQILDMADPDMHMGKEVPRVAGPHCARCTASATCPARAKLVVSTAAMALSLSPDRWLTLDEKARGVAMTNVREAIGMLERLKDQMAEKVREGLPVVGWRTVESARRDWLPGAEGRIAAAAERMGIDRERLYALRSPASLEDVLGATVVNENVSRTPQTKVVGPR